ncbi:KAP family P-loop NTPase fold protein [Ewingella americana]|uniref:Predicted P-loop ATPase n=2 Tax=Ewingella americana TaxID=41202 RepID=A0A377N902_9GAMM|nr:P-loop NTPase fold protein [Ewingella americana]KAA8727810.1 NTPase KAP [Ewingella americana]KFC79175.1 putative phage protein [Ewingella americana ATCC 33852]STQ43142.1 Predicted P-loop ATPase [Ewingella americana]
MNWDWSEEVQYLNETLPPDNLDRAKYAKFLYEVAAKRGETSNLVININAEWGAGKTHFTRRLAQTIQEKHPTVYVDAWKQDFSDDPLLAIFSCISEQLGNQSDKFISLMKKTEKKVGILLKGVAPAVVQGIIKKTTGIDDISEIAKSLTENMIELHKEKSAVIEDIKKDLSEWVQFIKQKDAMKKDLPIFIFIDELDRCRPSYAIDLLEIVKHIFDVKGMVFFISTDTAQLQHSIKVVYGQGFDAQHYLGRFFDRRFILAAPKINKLLMQKTASNFINEFSIKTEKLTPKPLSIENFITTLSNIFEGLEVNLRDSIKYYDKLCDIIITEERYYDPYLLLLLMFIYDKETDLYLKIKSKNEDNFKANDLLAYPNKLSYSFNKELTLKIDISEESTGVMSLYDRSEGNGYKYNIPNNNGVVNRSFELREYLITSLSIAKAENATSEYIDEYGNNVTERWMSGEIENDNSVDMFLKLSWAFRKDNSLDLKFDDYFDLVELSTILN